MTSFALKIIAVITMVIDHFGNSYFKGLTMFNLIGRIAFPIFAFQISEGYAHTKNLKKYFLKLFIFALISQIPFMLFLSLFSKNIYNLNIFFTLFIGLLAIYLYDKIVNSNLRFFNNFPLILKKAIGILLVSILAILANIINVDYGAFGIAIIFIFYLFKSNKVAMSLAFIAACVIKYSFNIINYGFNMWYLYLCLFTIIPIIFILVYNGKQGLKTKYLLYYFYPLHLLVLYLLFR